MEQKDLNWLRDTAIKGIYNRKDVIWQRAFTEYTRDTGIFIRMSCQVCYKKVLKFINDKYDIQKGTN